MQMLYSFSESKSSKQGWSAKNVREALKEFYMLIINVLGTKKLSKLATVHVNKSVAGSSRVTNENKLLTSKQK